MMMSWKTLSLLVAAAVAMNGAVALEQGYGGGIPRPTTATPSNESPVQSTDTATDAPTTGSSVDASSALDLGSASNSYPSKSDTALPSGSGSDNLYTGSAVEGSSATDESSSAANPGKTGITFSNSGSAVEGSSAIDQGSSSTPETLGSTSGSGVTVGSQEQQGSYGVDASTSASGSAPCDDSFSLAGDSETGSDVAGSSAVETSASGSEPCEGSLSLAGSSVDADSSAGQTTQGSATQDQGSDATTPTSEAGNEATTPTQTDASTPTSEAGSEASTPAQTDASTPASEAGSSATFPSTGTSCKRRLRRD
ncbi:unnamed protein product [Phytophthora lilii]|uniref:Unnamed protein product n=1 Tax=Phytophthora lilii TaxID=2077276 RepID=A0A9W6T950_9STRA|nr:unnamed protein product [Phytophthora lilii]